MENRRDSLIRAAFEHLALHGFEGLRLRAVATDAGIDHSTLHHHFRTKEDLVTAVVQYATSQFWDTMPADGDPAQRLSVHLATLTEMIQTRPALFAVLNEMRGRATRDVATAATVRHYEQGWREALDGLLKAGVTTGAFPAGLDIGAAVELIIAVTKGVNDSPECATLAFGELERLLRAEEHP
jgi:AcrR family transcriptional regulator